MPTVTLYADNDCYVEDDAPTTVANGTTIEAGWLSLKGVQTDRALLHFDVSSIASGVVVLSALYNLYGQSGFGSAQLDVERLTSAFDETTATWNTQPSASTLVTTLTPPGSESSYSWKSFDILTAVANWLSGAWTNYGVRVKAHDESTTGVILQWDSDEGANRPYLVVTYNTPPTQPGAFTNPLAGASVRGTITVAWPSSTDAEGDAITYRLRLSTDSGVTFPTTLVASTASSSAAVDFSPYIGQSHCVLRVDAIDVSGSNTYGTARDSGVFSVVASGPRMIIG